MCNAHQHPAGCECGFGPPYPNVSVTILSLLKSGNMRSSKAAELRFSFPLPKAKYFNLIDETGKERILATTAEALQQLADKRFGKGNVKVVPTRVEKGTLEVYAFLVSVGMAVYQLFKDRKDLKKRVTQFTKDVGLMSSKLNLKVRKRYLSEERRSLKKASREQKLKEETLEAKRKEKEIVEQLKANNTKKLKSPAS